MELFTKEERESILPQGLNKCGEVFAGEYEWPGLRTLDVKTILDIGANVGVFVIWASRYFPNVREIYSYEPNDALVTHRVRNFETFAKDLENISIASVVAGVGQRDEHVPIYDVGKRDDGFTTTLYSSQTKRVGTAWTVPAAELPKADVVKIDCEGAECFLFSDYLHFQTAKAVLLEWHTVPNRVYAEDVLARAGLICVRGHGDHGIHEGFGIAYGVQIWVRR